MGCATVKQEEYSLSHSPKWGCAELVATRAALRHVVRQTCSHVVDFNVGERANWCLGQRGGDVRSLSGVDRWSMAGGASDGREQCLTGRDRGGAARCGARGCRRG